jgi:hypothetical protein
MTVLPGLAGRAATSGAPAKGDRRRHEALGVALAITATMAYWLSQAWHHVAYLNDDLILFNVASKGLSRHLLAYNLYEHFAPLDHLFYWIELRLAPFDPLTATAIITALVLGMLLALEWLLRELQVGCVMRALAVAVLGTSVVTFVASTWWGAGVDIPVALTAILLIMAAHVRAMRLRSWRWHLVTVALMAVGVAVSERAIFTAEYLVLLDFAVGLRQGTLRAGWQRVWSAKWWLAPVFAVAVAGAALIGKYYYLAYPLPPMTEVVKLVSVTFGKWFVPALAGSYTSVGAPRAIALLFTGLAVAVCAWLIAIDRRNLGPILLFGVAFVTDYVFLGINRLGIYPIADLGGNLDYAAWILPVFAVSVALLRVPKTAIPRVLRHARLGVAVAGLAGVAILANTAWFVQSKFTILNHGYQYWTNLRADESEWSSHSVTVLPLGMPLDLAAPFVDPYGRLDVVLPEVDPDVRVGLHDPGSSPRVVMADGTTRAAALRPAVTAGAAALAGARAVDGALTSRDGLPCFTGATPAAYLQVTLPRPVTGAPLLLELAYYADRDSTVSFTTVSGAGGANINPVGSALYAGTHTGVFPLDGVDAAQLQITSLSAGVRVCFTSLAIDTPVLPAVDGTCRTVDRFGDVGDLTPCTERQ